MAWLSYPCASESKAFQIFDKLSDIYGKITSFFSQSFHYAGFHDQKGQFHERLAPLYEPTAIDIVRNQGAGTELQNRKLPDLPDSKFNPVHSTARRNPLSVRSAPNLHRLENIILVNESPIPKTDDSSGESGFNEKSPLIRKSQRYEILNNFFINYIIKVEI